MYFALKVYADPGDPDDREWIVVTRITQEQANVLLDLRQGLIAERRLRPSSFTYWWDHSMVFRFDSEFAVAVEELTTDMNVGTKNPFSWEADPPDPLSFDGETLSPVSLDIAYVAVTRDGVRFNLAIDPGNGDCNQHCDSAELPWHLIEQVAAGTYVPSHSHTSGAAD